jgi:imidazolonepropionase-like amidohydrolase
MSARRRARLGFAVLAAMCVTQAFPGTGVAQDLAVTGGTVYTGSGPALEGATVFIRDGRIAAVGPDVEIPPGTPSLDATGLVVTPGLVDAFTNLGLVEVGMVRSSVDFGMNDDPVRAAFDVVDGINPRSVLIPVNRSGGLTTVLSGPSGGLVSGQAAVIDLAGASLQEMLARPRAAMLASYGAGPASAVGGSRGAVSLRLRETLDDALYWRDHREDFDEGRSRSLSQSRLDLEALGPVLDGEMPLIVTVHRASDIEAVLRIAADYGLDLVIAGASEGWMVAARLADTGVPVIVKPLTNNPRGFDRLGSRLDNATLLHQAGVDVIISSFDTHNAHHIKLEAGNAVRMGLPWEAALRAVTLAPAQALGVGSEYGSLEPGKVGNVVVWTGDPFELSTRVESVVIRGRETSMDSRQKALLRRYREIDDERPAFKETGP